MAEAAIAGPVAQVVWTHGGRDQDTDRWRVGRHIGALESFTGLVNRHGQCQDAPTCGMPPLRGGCCGIPIGGAALEDGVDKVAQSALIQVYKRGPLVAPAALATENDAAGDPSLDTAPINGTELRVHVWKAGRGCVRHHLRKRVLVLPPRPIDPRHANPIKRLPPQCRTFT